MRFARPTSLLLLSGLLVISLGLHECLHAQGGGQAGPQRRAAPIQTLDITSDSQLATLIISTLVTLNDANFTGNYSLLREIASPNFQASNGSGRPSGIFTELRDWRFDFSPIILLQPKLVRTPSIDRSGRLRLTGYFATVELRSALRTRGWPLAVVRHRRQHDLRSNVHNEFCRSLTHEPPDGPSFLHCLPKR